MSRRKTASILAMLLAFVLILSACNTTDTPSTAGTEPTQAPSGTEPTTTGGTEPTAGGNTREDIVMYINSDVASLDSAYTSLINEDQILHQVQDCLILVDTQHIEHMRLAESYEISDDGLVYTFHLRQGVKFHNGEEFKASDCVFSYDKFTTSPYKATQTEQIASYRAVDDYTFEITVKEVFAPFIEIGVSGLLIQNEKAATEAGDAYKEHPVGTGPYVFVSREAASQIKLTRFDDYFRGTPRIKDVTFKMISDPNTATIAVQTGEIDLGSFSPSAYENMIADSNLVVEQPSTSHITYLMMNVEAAPLDNVKVRQAINYAIDRQFIVDAVMSGFARATSISIAPEVFGYSADMRGYEYNPDKAKELLAEAGIVTPYDLGKLKTLEGNFATTAQLIQSSLADIGLIVELEVLEATKYIEEAQRGDYVLGMMGMSVGEDADAFSVMYTTKNINGLNMSRYGNPAVDQMFADARAELDREKRIALYTECFNILNDEAVYAPLYNQNRLYAHNKNLQIDYVYNPMAFTVYEMAWK